MSETNQNELTPEIVDRIKKLQEKYSASGQELVAYLDGLLYADYISYWDYIHLDTLLSLQNPRTPFKDEPIFIMYHQITELYFKLVLHEMDQIANNEAITGDFFVTRIKRVNRYFEALTKSFDVMYQGMEREQFLKFRMSLIPASGFQSAQYRKIELCSTDMKNLIHLSQRDNYSHGTASVEEMFDHLYWKHGAIEVETGLKTLTLRQFEEKYTKELIEVGEKYRTCNMWQVYKRLSEEDQKRSDVIEAMKSLDLDVNVHWPMVHLKSAITYLKARPSDARATGGTNWNRYLPPKFQKRIFFPELWSEKEREEWGRHGVERILGEDI